LSPKKLLLCNMLKIIRELYTKHLFRHGGKDASCKALC
jgi:hypothetical protein